MVMTVVDSDGNRTEGNSAEAKAKQAKVPEGLEEVSFYSILINNLSDLFTLANLSKNCH